MLNPTTNECETCSEGTARSPAGGYDTGIDAATCASTSALLSGATAATSSTSSTLVAIVVVVVATVAVAGIVLKRRLNRNLSQGPVAIVRPAESSDNEFVEFVAPAHIHAPEKEIASVASI